MFLTNHPDFTIPILPNILLICGLPFTVLLFILVSIIEAFLLRWLIPEARAFKDSFLMNAVTTLLGWFPSILPGMVAGGLPQLLLYWIPIGWLISVGVEGVVLRFLERSCPIRQVFLASLAVNSLSYLLLAILVLILPSWTFQR
jgi:hypothetical protein